SSWDSIRTVPDALRLPTLMRSVPLGIALGAARVMEVQASITGREPFLTRYSVQILARTQTYDIAAARRDLGYAPRISFAEGMRRTLIALGAQGNEEAGGRRRMVDKLYVLNPPPGISTVLDIAH